LTPVLVFDLETIPDVAGIRRLGLAPEGLDDRETVAHVQAERAAKGQGEFLPLYLQRVLTIGCAFRDQEGFRVKCLGDGFGAEDADEAQRIRQFFNAVERHVPQLVTWNGGGFDFPVLHHRAMQHGIVAPQYWDQGDHNRDFKYNNYLSRYHSRHLDLMDVLANFSGRANAPLDAMAQLCGFPGKLGEDGAKVWDAFLDGRADGVAAYCETDVVNTYLLYVRFQTMRGQLSAEAAREEMRLVRASLSAKIGQPGELLEGAHWTRFLDAWTTDL
jgi:predicted PolB exonuclease-like 3'-5' exonuclease